MASVDEVASLLARLLTTALAPAGEPPDSGGFFSSADDEGKLVGVHVTTEGLVLVDEIIVLLRADPQASDQLRQEDAHQEVGQVIVEGAIALDAGALDVGALAGTLIARIGAGRHDWTVMLPVPGLVLPAATALDLAGLTIGSLTAEPLARAAETLRRLSSQGHDAGETERLDSSLTSYGSWAVGAVMARDESANVIVEERLSHAVDILQSFALLMGINPDTTHLGQERVRGQRPDMRWNSTGTFVLGESIIDAGHPYELDATQLVELVGDQCFRRARAIVAATARNDMEEKILWGMRLFGEASRAETSEKKVLGYVTVLETVLAREGTGPGTDRNDRHRKIARRLTLFIASVNDQPVLNVLERIYEVRTQHAHHGYSGGIQGQEFATRRDVEVAQGLAFRALRIALHESEPYTTRAEFISELDRRSGVPAS